jgi:hypothetical protein
MIPIKNISLLALICILFSCNNKKVEKQNNIAKPEESSNTVSFYNKKYRDFDKMEALKKAIKSKGDTIAFIELEEIYFNSRHGEEFLYYAIFMANAYNYSGGYMAVYRILHTDFGAEKYQLNDRLANYYLLKAYELGNRSASFSIEDRFYNVRIPTSKEYWSLLYSENAPPSTFIGQRIPK